MSSVEDFEKLIADFYGADYAVATDCCTHALELCLRLTETKRSTCPTRTYLSVPMTFMKLNIDWAFYDIYWKDFYFLGNTNIIDGAVYWEKNGYKPGNFLCLSFQFKKHLSLGRGGMILTDDKEAAKQLKKMSYDGRLPNIPWAEQNVDTMGYHYYMTPEIATLGIEKFQKAKTSDARKWDSKDYPNLTTMEIFNAIKK